MKKIFIALAAMTLLCAPASGQAFLNKLKEKASQAVGNVVSGAIGEKIQDAIPDNLKGAASAAQGEAPTAVTGEQALPPRRASTFGWDGPVTPSSASFPIPLMNEFPAVPAAASLANPVETEQIAYYKAIKAVTLRAEELNAENTCDEEMTRLWREKSNKLLHDIFGLTEAEIRELEDENLPEAERKRLEDKMAKALLGDIDVDALEKQAADLQGKDAMEAADAMVDKGLAATFAMPNKAVKATAKVTRKPGSRIGSLAAFGAQARAAADLTLTWTAPDGTEGALYIVSDAAVAAALLDADPDAQVAALDDAAWALALPNGATLRASDTALQATLPDGTTAQADGFHATEAITILITRP